MWWNFLLKDEFDFLLFSSWLSFLLIIDFTFLVLVRGIGFLINISSFFNTKFVSICVLFLMIYYFFNNWFLSIKLSEFSLKSIIFPLTFLLIEFQEIIQFSWSPYVIFFLIIFLYFGIFLPNEFKRIKKYRIIKYSKKRLVPLEKKIIFFISAILGIISIFLILWP